MAKVSLSQRAIISSCTDLYGNPQDNFRARYILRPGQIIIFDLDEDDGYPDKCFFIFVPAADGYTGNHLRCSAADLSRKGKKLTFHTFNSIYEVLLLEEEPEIGYHQSRVKLVGDYLVRNGKTDPETMEKLRRLYDGTPEPGDIFFLYKMSVVVELIAQGLLEKEAAAAADSYFRSLSEKPL